MQTLVYESCKYAFPQSVLHKMETQMRSKNVGVFPHAALSSPLCASVRWADGLRVPVSAWSGGTVAYPKRADDTQKPLLMH